MTELFDEELEVILKNHWNNCPASGTHSVISNCDIKLRDLIRKAVKENLEAVRPKIGKCSGGRWYSDAVKEFNTAIDQRIKIVEGK